MMFHPDTSDTLDTIVEETGEQINDVVALDAALEDQSLITAKVPASESELSSNDQVVSMEDGETKKKNENLTAYQCIF